MARNFSRREFVKLSSLTGAAALAGCIDFRPTPTEGEKNPTASTRQTSADVGYDGFGGWKGAQGKKSGFFHMEQKDGFDYFVSSDGNLFWSKGPNHITFGEHVDVNGVSEWHQNNIRKYGTERNWATAIVSTLKDLKVNTIGAWSSEVLLSDSTLQDSGISYTAMLYLNEDGSQRERYFSKGFSDYFDPNFQASMIPVAERWCAPRKNDKHCIGFFPGSEMFWGNDWRSPLSLLERMLDELEPSAPGRQRADAFMSERGLTRGTLSTRDSNQFAGIAAEEFMKHAVAAIRKYDTNHLILGVRFAGSAPAEVIQAVAKYSDVISVDDFARMPQYNLATAYAVAKKPVMLTQFGARAKDSGLSNTIGAGPLFDRQIERSAFIGNVYVQLPSVGYVVGAHLSEYSDQPAAGRQGDGANSNMGIFNVKGEKYPVADVLPAVLSMIESTRVTAASSRNAR